MKELTCVISICAAVLSSGGPGKAAKTTESGPDEKAAVAQVIHDSICWALTKDRALEESTMSHEDDLFIFWVDSGTTIAGWKQFVKLFDTWMDPRFKAMHTEIRDLQIHIAPCGQVAWYSAMLDDLNEWDGKPVGASDIRWTGVLEKRDGKWVVVQMHGSVARDKILEQLNQKKEVAAQ
jgi:ketosteroid isomerase-like protein